MGGSQGPDQGVGVVRAQMVAARARWRVGALGQDGGVGALGWNTRQGMGFQIGDGVPDMRFQSGMGFQTKDGV